MSDQTEFKAALGDLLLLAKASGLQVTEREIRECFPGWELTPEQWRLIYSYLELNQILVEGHESDRGSLAYLRGSEEEQGTAKKTSGKGLTGEDSRCYKMYLEEIQAIRELSEEEIPGLLAALKAGDRAARNRLAEGHLKRVVELAKEYSGRGVHMADLVQEGNMALLTAMEEFDDGDFGVYITREICSAMDMALAEQTGEQDTGSYLAAQANAIMEATEELVKELGREATLSEVAQRMNLSEDMTRDIMKISMDALAVVEAHGSGEKFGGN
ncbi:MAG: hypothetical protein HFI67_05725 [Lachnospiraceae bacterium]|jgi:RNA polymerase primary sigma factor|nr:hypothetical protein [Lachnospiraceae bacterium]